jgi:2-oxoisovalerate dehydrogenase E1 component
MWTTNWQSVFSHMVASRRIDEVERELVHRGDAFFHVSGSGHEATVVIARHLLADDFLHCHYRDKALLLARGVPSIQFFNSLLCNAAGHSAGRQMSAHLSNRERHVLSLVGPVGNNALQAVGIAAEIKHRPARPIVLCLLGDGTSQEGEVLEAIAESVRWELPVLFVVHDNRYSISATTLGKTFFSSPQGNLDEFYGLPIHRVDGRDAVASDEPLERLVAKVRRTRRPSIVVLDVERLSDHTNADDEHVYRTEDEINVARRTGDPVAILRGRLLESGISEQQLGEIERAVRAESDFAAAAAFSISARAWAISFPYV